jgi:hypothetical protein
MWRQSSRLENCTDLRQVAIAWINYGRFRQAAQSTSQEAAAINALDIYSCPPEPHGLAQGPWLRPPLIKIYTGRQGGTPPS